MAPSVQRDLGGPVVEGARHEDLLGRTGPPEDRGPGLSAGTLAVALQVLLPRQELLDLLRSLVETTHLINSSATDAAPPGGPTGSHAAG